MPEHTHDHDHPHGHDHGDDGHGHSHEPPAGPVAWEGVTVPASGGGTLAWFHCFSGIAGDMAFGSLVDADMNKESTKLQALQVQQQLGIQALSIANQNSQTVLSLFR